MKAETRAQVSEALVLSASTTSYGITASACQMALDALAAEPDETTIIKCLTCGKQCPNDCPMDKPTVGKSVEELAEKITFCYYGENEGVTTPSEEYKAQELIQQFLDFQLAERDKEIAKAIEFAKSIAENYDADNIAHKL